MSEIMKSGVVEDDIRLINTFSKIKLNEDNVYTFKIVCCDNQIDRDFERFGDKALEQMAELYIGKPVLKDHIPVTDNQVARIYKTSVENIGAEPGRSGSNGNCVKRLVASVYIPITNNTKGLISDIETGIKKEVSVSCAIESYICSICGKDLRACNHRKSKLYDGDVCCGIIDNVSDVYELSFVAIPAQRNAGVIKSFKSIPLPLDTALRSEKDGLSSALQVRLRLAKAEEYNLNFESEEIENESK